MLVAVAAAAADAESDAVVLGRLRDGAEPLTGGGGGGEPLSPKKSNSGSLAVSTTGAGGGGGSGGLELGGGFTVTDLPVVKSGWTGFEARAAVGTGGGGAAFDSAFTTD